MTVSRALCFMALSLVVVLAGCGRRGPLEAPVGSGAQANAAPSAAPADIVASPAGSASSTSSTSGLTTSVPGRAVVSTQTFEGTNVTGNPITGNKKGRAPMRPKDSFFLDPLID